MFRLGVNSSLFIKESIERGRGVFTRTKLKKNKVIEISPVLVVPPEKIELLKETMLFHYYYTWMEDKQYGALVTGYGMLYNHSYNPNVESTSFYNRGLMLFKTLREIESGEELLINYGGYPESKTEMWFEIK